MPNANSEDVTDGANLESKRVVKDRCIAVMTGTNNVVSANMLVYDVLISSLDLFLLELSVYMYFTSSCEEVIIGSVRS